MRSVTALPNLLTLANAFCGLLAISKAIDALALSGVGDATGEIFYVKMETAAWLIFLGMVFDALDGRVARITGSESAFGAQLDSFSDAITFGVAPGLLAKVLIEHDGPLVGYHGSPRLHFLAAVSFTLMAVLRLVRFNLETGTDDENHDWFRGLPSPGAAGAVASSILLYLALRKPELVEVDDGTQTPVGHVVGLLPDLPFDAPGWFLPVLALYLPLLGFLMVSRLRYAHMASYLTRRGTFFTFVGIVFTAIMLFAAPIPALFVCFNGFVLHGLVRGVALRTRSRMS
jgi:CDP-diacylglycerol--serine O-phosphatidyltransferase